MSLISYSCKVNMEEKRKAKNVTTFEKNLVVDLVQSKINVLENKKTDTVSNEAKNQAWNAIAAAYNGSCQTGHRTPKQLKDLYGVNSDTSSEDEAETVDNEELISTGQDGLANDEDNEPAREVQHDKGSPVPLSTPKRTEKPATKTRTTTSAVDEFQIFGSLCYKNKEPKNSICQKYYTGTARETLIVSNCATWAQVKTTLLNRFGDQRNETLLENDLITCYQFSNEIYEQYYERLKSKLKQILEHINIKEENVNIKTFKKQMYEQRAQNTFCAGLLEPYRSFISNKTIASLEDALTQLRNYDNHQQQVSFLNFIRHKQPSQFSKQTSHQTKQPLKSTQIQKPSHSYNYQQPSLNMRFSHHSNQFPRGPINIQSRPIQSNFPTNSQVFGKKPEFKPTPMSVNTRNTFQSNRNQNQPQLQRNHFQQTGPRNFTSEELYNVEQSDNNEHKSEYFEDVSTLNQSFENFNTNISNEITEIDHDDEEENFCMPASIELTST
ncbi:hypothetical protein FQR65_LT17531 [Abscondita terminalis]|nr:hypothetical protein FQR65_LT17531 [Abscondita terminalis]